MIAGRRTKVLIAAAVVLLLTAVYWLWRIDREDERQTPLAISVIVAGGDASGRWRALDQGIGQACAELGIEKPVITQARGTRASQLEDTIARAISNGTRGFLIVGEESGLSGVDSGVLSGIPVVALGDASSIYPTVGADDAAMGAALADYMVGQTKDIAMLDTGSGREDIVRRREAFCSRVAELGGTVTRIECDPRADDLIARLASTFATHDPPIGMLAVLDNDMLEASVEALPASMVDVTLCGIGGSDSLVHALDSGDVHCLVFVNEYATGYMGTMLLASEMRLIRDYRQSQIQYRLVTRDTMYLEENERLLFPIIQ